MSPIQSQCQIFPQQVYGAVMQERWYSVPDVDANRVLVTGSERC
jgi:hypothetical protein